MAIKTSRSVTPMKWVVVLCLAQAEWQVHTGLMRAGVRSFLPYTLGSSRRGRWSHGVVKPQYPGYLFAALEEGVTTQTIKRAHGVRELLKASGGLVYLSAPQISSLKKQWLEDYRNAAPKLVRKPVLKVGDWVMVPHGPFLGVPCQINLIDKSGNVSASLGTLQVTFHMTDVAATSVRGSAKPANSEHSRLTA